MQYQIFVQCQSEKNFLASVVGIPNLTAEGRTEEEAIFKIKSVLEKQLATGKFVTIEVNPEIQPNANTPQMKYADLIIEELEAVSEGLLGEVLDFVRFLKVKQQREALENQQDIEDSYEALAEAEEKGTTSLEAFKVELGL